DGTVAGVEPWVRAFGLQHVEADPPVPGRRGSSGSWTVHAPAGHPLAEPLRQGLQRAGIGDGVLLCLPADCEEDQVELFLAAARDARAAIGGTGLVVVEHGRGAAGLAKTLHLEAPQVTTCVVDLAELAGGGPAAGAVATAVDRVVTEAAGVNGFAEVRYDAAG